MLRSMIPIYLEYFVEIQIIKLTTKYTLIWLRVESLQNAIISAMAIELKHLLWGIVILNIKIFFQTKA